MGGFNWVAARSECSLDRQFRILAELVDSDVKVANGLNKRGIEFEINLDVKDKIIVLRKRDIVGHVETSVIVFELEQDKITVKDRTDRSNLPGQMLFNATPSLNEEGECLLEVSGVPLKLWQVSRKALDGLFFRF
jgi:hypothetical protein